MVVAGKGADRTPRARRGRTRSCCWQGGLEGGEGDVWLRLVWKEVDVKE